MTSVEERRRGRACGLGALRFHLVAESDQLEMTAETFATNGAELRTLKYAAFWPYRMGRQARDWREESWSFENYAR